MKRWRLWVDLLVVWLYYAIIQAAIALVKLIRRGSQDGEGTP
jgi:multisubunit Na+/H+ antiporter MnhE subunit